MYLIDETYFQRDLVTPNSQELSSDGGVSNELNVLETYIDERSRLFLKDALGYELFKDLDSNIDSNGDLLVTAPQKWKDLVNGKEYTSNGELVRWQGLLITEGAFKSSILADYTYYHWLMGNLSTMTGVGDVVVEAKNAINVRSNQRLISIWNRIVDKNQFKCNTNYAHRSIVRGVEFVDWFSSSTNNFVSLVQFLDDNDTDYPEATKRLYNYKNQFGI